MFKKLCPRVRELASLTKAARLLDHATYGSAIRPSPYAKFDLCLLLSELYHSPAS